MTAPFRDTFQTSEPMSGSSLSADMQPPPPAANDAREGGSSSKICPHCGKCFYRTRHASGPNFRKRVYCSQRCNADAKKARTDAQCSTVHCEQCGKVIKRRPEVSVAAYRKLRFCSHKCQGLHRRSINGTPIQEIVEDDIGDAPIAPSIEDKLAAIYAGQRYTDSPTLEPSCGEGPWLIVSPSMTHIRQIRTVSNC